METALELARALEASPFGAWARGSASAYPAANVVHLLGLVLLVGGIGVVDLRVTGLFRALPLAETSRALTPVAVLGLLLMIPSGFVMLAADAAPMVQSPTYRWKMGLLVLALANAGAFRLIWRDLGAGPAPILARLMALASIGLWLWIATLGRLIAYS